MKGSTAWADRGEPESGSDHRTNDDPEGAEAVPQAILVWERMLRTVEGLLQTFEDDMKGDGFSLTWYDVLIQLRVAPKHRLRMQDLATAVTFTRSGLTRLIDRMEKEGLVERGAVENDRRGAYAILTDKGLATFERYNPGHRAAVHEHFSRHLDDDDLRALSRALKKIPRGKHQAPTTGDSDEHEP